MTITKNVWAVFAADEEMLTLETCLGYSTTLIEARRIARLEFAERFVEEWTDPRIKIMSGTFRLSREYLVRAMNSYQGTVEPCEYRLKEYVELLPDKARAIYEAFHGPTEEETDEDRDPLSEDIAAALHGEKRTA